MSLRRFFATLVAACCGSCISAPRSESQRNAGPVKVVVEIPDSLDPSAADAKYSTPLREWLLEAGNGKIVSVKQGEPMTPDEFSRFITLELNDYDINFERLGNFLEEIGVPVGAFYTSYNENGEKRDIFVFAID